jgi:hypothetical protein
MARMVHEIERARSRLRRYHRLPQTVHDVWHTPTCKRGPGDEKEQGYIAMQR